MADQKNYLARKKVNVLAKNPSQNALLDGLRSDPINRMRGYVASSMSHVPYRNPINAPEISLGDVARQAIAFAPGIGDLQSGAEALDYAQQGRPAMAGLAGLGALPFIPFVGGSIAKNIENVTELKNIDDVVRIVKNSPDTLFVRWSSGDDIGPGKFSRDYLTGEKHAGLSAVPLSPDMSKSDIAKYFSEYNFLRMKDQGIKPRLYSGEVVGVDSDLYPSIRPLKEIGFAGDSLLSDIDKGMSRRVFLDEAINDARKRLEIITDPIGRKIVEKDMLKKIEELKNMN